MPNIVNFGQAEQNARLRDIELERQKQEIEYQVPQEELHKALDILNRATGKEHYIGTKKSIHSKIRFAQFMQQNWLHLREQKYLTSEEKVFLTDIQCNISMHSNAIVDDIKKQTPSALNIISIAELLETSRPKVSRIINSLIKKGVLAKSVSGDVKQSHQAKDYVLFVNPHIIFSGNKDYVSEHLVLQFQNVMKNNKVLQKLPDRFF
jgi:hypothetical protein